MRLASAGDKGRQPFDILFIRGLKLRTLLRLLRLTLRLVLVAGIERLLPFARRKRLTVRGRLIAIAVIIRVFGGAGARLGAGLLLIIGLTLTILLLSGCDQAEVMLGVLIVVFGRNRITRTLRIPCELEILFGDMRSRAANLHVGSVGFIYSGQWILMMMVVTAFAIAAPHAFVLTVSHGSLFANPLACCGNSTAISLTMSAPIWAHAYDC